MKISLQNLRDEIERTKGERNQRYPKLIQGGALHRSMATKYYQRIEVIGSTLEVMTEDEFHNFVSRKLENQKPKANQQHMLLGDG